MTRLYGDWPKPYFVRVSRPEAQSQTCYAWDISADEQRRLTVLLGRAFSECNVAGTYATAPPRPCKTCGKWTELIDWIYTAIERQVHTPAFLFHALKRRLLPVETAHDVYCSACGSLTHCRSRNRAEGGAPDIQAAGPLTKAQINKYVPDDSKFGAWPNHQGWLYETPMQALHGDIPVIEDPLT